MKVIITGVTGMVGEGVLLECMTNPKVSDILIVGRREYKIEHPKVKQLLLSDFSKVGDYQDQVKGYDTCFFCAGVSSIGENEESFTKKTYDFVIPFATSLSVVNPSMTFIYVSGKGTDSSEKGKVMWARVKGRTENALTRLPFKQVFNFRPAIMKGTKGQMNVKPIFKILIPLLAPFYPAKTLKLSEVGQAMINISAKGFEKTILEPEDIYKASK
ncbi:MAG: NAD-dependent epimerase/dehydratase family protein [Cytophagaceae bacterium]